ncbi:hypothetical protein DPMN_026206 [Dreissena polymorpha]|uniref:Uncharacterized protein n=1 Tax=Dreissena polymorpha TaxID=45954 RepID=A0A9D4LSH4_DREPO|nr:hypothetical protein DPMN_026206 [Dreissena polymorpha]
MLMPSVSFYENFPKIVNRDSFTLTNSLPTSNKSIASVAHLCTWSVMRWVGLSCVIDVRRYVFRRLRPEKDLSLVALVAGITRTWRRTRVTFEKKRRDSGGKSRKNVTMSVMVLTFLSRTATWCVSS